MCRPGYINDIDAAMWNNGNSKMAGRVRNNFEEYCRRVIGNITHRLRREGLEEDALEGRVASEMVTYLTSPKRVKMRPVSGLSYYLTESIVQNFLKFNDAVSNLTVPHSLDYVVEKEVERMIESKVKYYTALAEKCLATACV